MEVLGHLLLAFAAFGTLFCPIGFVVGLLERNEEDGAQIMQGSALAFVIVIVAFVLGQVAVHAAA